MNNCSIVGNLTKDTELTYSSTGTAILKNSVAVRRDKDNSDFINITSFGKTAELIANNFSKGHQIGINGRIQTGSYEKNGQKVYTTEVIVNSITFIRGNGQAQPTNQGGNNHPNSFGGQVTDVNEDDLPF